MKLSLVVTGAAATWSHLMMITALAQQEAISASFDILRDPSSCQAVTMSSSLEPANGTETCSLLDWSHIQQMQAYTTFEQDGMTIEARIGPLFVENSDPRLDYECPPDEYNGFDYRFSFCKLDNNSTLMAVAYVTTMEDGTASLLGMDVILSGSPFPTDLEENKPPFGAARFIFDFPLTVLVNGTVAICPDDTREVSCDGVVAEQTLDLKGLVFSAFGIFSLAGLGYTGPSVWIHDDNRQLLHLTAGEANAFWFNESGYFLADFLANTCTWFDNCNFACEVYNYDSRFLDFIGIWNITGKFGMDEFESQEVKVYLGNAIDAAGVFPSLMYISIEEGYYLGLDKLDTTLGTGGSSFWYSQANGDKPVFEDYQIPDDMGCPGTTDDWLGATGSTPPETPPTSSPEGEEPVATDPPGPFSTGNAGGSWIMAVMISLVLFLNNLMIK